MSKYTEFVKKQMKTEAIQKLPFKDRMKTVAKEWKNVKEKKSN